VSNSNVFDNLELPLKVVPVIASLTRMLHCENKPANILFDLASSPQRTTIVSNRFRASHSVLQQLTTSAARRSTVVLGLQQMWS